LNEETNIDVLVSLSRDLCFHCDAKRIIHIPRALAFFESALEVDSKFSDPRILINIINGLYRILYYERHRDFQDQENIERIKGTLKHIRRTVDEQPDYTILQKIIPFFGETGEEEAVTILFEMAEQLPDETYSDVKGQIVDVLTSKDRTLYPHKQLINDQILRMISNADATIKKRGIALAQEKRKAHVHS
jgi:hypothetical protein